MKLKPLTLSEYDTYVQKAIKNYTQEIMTSGVLTKEMAEQESQSTYKRLLPDGFNTKNNYFCYAYDEDIKVGFIWYCMRGDQAFIYDFYVDESKRRKGYGRKIMLVCEKAAKEKGAKTIGLHVFGHNKPARALYESLDYYPVSIQMRKDL